MSTWSRAARSVARHPGASIGVAVVVALTIGVFFILSDVDASVTANSAKAVSSVQSVVTVQLAGGSYGGGFFSFSIGAGVTPSAVQAIATTAGVSATQRFLTEPEQLALPGGSLCGSDSDPNVQAMDTNSPIFLLNGGLGGATSLTLQSGRTLSSSDEQGNGALVGSLYAQDLHLALGSPLSVNGNPFVVVGIFQASACASGGYTIILPFPAGSSALSNPNATIVYAYVNQYSSVHQVIGSLSNELGSGYAVQSLANANHESLAGAVASILASTAFAQGATLVGGALVLVVVVAVVTSRRTREIGLMKALGYGTSPIIGQVSLESLAIALAGLPLAAVVALLLGPTIAGWAVSGVGGPGGSYVASQLLGGASFQLSLSLLLVGVVVTASFGLVGALYPSIRAARLPPSEALRHE